MSDRNKPHVGRDLSGHRKVRQVDVDDLLTEGPQGSDFLEDDIKLAGAVEDVGADAGRAAASIGDRIEENREDVLRATGRSSGRGGRRGGRRSASDDRGMR